MVKQIHVPLDNNQDASYLHSNPSISLPGYFHRNSCTNTALFIPSELTPL